MSRGGHIMLSNVIGVLLMILGWYLSILNIGLTRLENSAIFTGWTLTGLVLIIIGAYLPRVWKKFLAN